MTLHLTYTYLWVFLGIVWLVGVFLGNRLLMFEATTWWEYLAVLVWPVILPVVIILKVLFLIFWPEY
jgi:hypothetical protein